MLKLKQAEPSTREIDHRTIMALSRVAASRGFALILVACCSLMLAAAGGGVDDDGVGGDKLMMDRFLRWQATYNRSYPTAEERQRRFQVYRRNMEHIEATNRAGNLTYTLGENQFADLTEEEFLDLYTMKGMPPVRRDAGKKQANFSSSAAVDAPTSVDWRSKGAVTPIKNQGPSCCACSVINIYLSIYISMSSLILTCNIYYTNIYNPALHALQLAAGHS
jgi:cathepsin L